MTSSWRLRRAAAVVREQAATLPGALDRAMEASGLDTWQGPAAQRFLDEAATTAAALMRLAAELSLVGEGLEQEATRAEWEELVAAGWHR